MSNAQIRKQMYAQIGVIKSEVDKMSALIDQISNNDSGEDPTPVATSPPRDAQVIRSSNEFREALESSGERIVYVEQGLKLKTDRSIQIKHDGLTLMPTEYTLEPDGFYDQLIHLRARATITGLAARHGLGTHGNPSKTGDVLSLYPGCTGSILRQCTLTEGTDEVLDGWGAGMNDVTIEDCIIAFGVEPHSMGMIVGGGKNYNWTVRRCLFAGCNNRNPLISVKGLRCYNNFIYRDMARGIQAFARYEDQDQHYFNNFVWHKDGKLGSWGSANAGAYGDVTLRLHAQGNMDNVRRTSLDIDEREFWSSDESDGAPQPQALRYLEPIYPVVIHEPSVLQADKIWRSIRHTVGAPYRSPKVKAMVDEIEAQQAA